MLTGACLARAGLNRRAAYATAMMAIAAEFPDIDTVWSLRGSVMGFAHHRGITHTFIGIPFEALFLLGCAYGFDRWRVARAKRSEARQWQRRTVTPPAPRRWATLYLLLLVALGSHLLLDYTNNYGLRPFYPFDARWYAGSFVFIFDPLLFFFLVVGLVLPALFSFVGSEVGAKRETFTGRGWARAALVAMVLLWLVRWIEHRRAVVLAAAVPVRASSVAGQVTSGGGVPSGVVESPPPQVILMPQRTLASPDPLSIFRWYAVSDLGSRYELGTVDTRRHTLEPYATYDKPLPSAVLSMAEETELGRVFLDWSPMPVLRVSGPDASSRTGESQSLVLFLDPRFVTSSPLLQRGGTPPLMGQVLINGADGKVLEGMNGHLDEEEVVPLRRR